MTTNPTLPPSLSRISVIRTLPRLLALLVLVLSAAGCTHVEPWQRGVLAKPQMALQPPALQHGFRKHTYGSREAIAGTDASSGGGCGCY